MDKTQIQLAAETKTRQVWDFFRARYPQLNPNPPRIILNGRFTRAAGCNHSAERIIELGTKFYEKFFRTMTDVIVPHEICHQVDYDINGWYDRKRHHGKPWQDLMREIRLDPEPYHNMEL